MTRSYEADRAALTERLNRVLGYVPVGTKDLLNVLAHPDVLPYSLAFLTSAQATDSGPSSPPEGAPGPAQNLRRVHD